MKKIFLSVILLFVSTLSYSQVGLGKNLKDIKQKYSDGKIIENEKGGYTYIYFSEETLSYFFYFLDSKLDCYSTAVKPQVKEAVDVWVSNLNSEWVKVHKNEWNLYYKYGLVNQELVGIVNCKLIKEKKQPIFLFTIKI